MARRREDVRQARNPDPLDAWLLPGRARTGTRSSQQDSPYRLQQPETSQTLLYRDKEGKEIDSDEFPLKEWFDLSIYATLDAIQDPRC